MNPENPYNPNGQAPYQPQGAPAQPQQPFQQPGQPQQLQQPYAVPQPQQQPGYAPMQPAQVPPVAHRKKSNLWLILSIVFIFTTLVGAGVAVYAYMGYLEEKGTVDSQVTSAVADAVKEEQDVAAKHLLEVENTPNRSFAGPSDYGNLSFSYSKLWSVYVNKDASKGGTYEAYLNPVTVPPVAPAERYALRVTIEEKDYDEVVSSYQRLVTDGSLSAGTYKIDETTSGTRLDGNFTKDIRGSAVIFKIRDKTVTLRTDAETFKEYFDALIKTVKYDK